MRGRLARRRGRLLIACSGNRQQVRGVESMLAIEARQERARRRRRAEQRRHLEAA